MRINDITNFLKKYHLWIKLGYTGIIAIAFYYMMLKYIFVIRDLAQLTTTFLEGLDFAAIPYHEKTLFIFFTWWLTLGILSTVFNAAINLLSFSENKLKEYDYLRLKEKYEGSK